MTLYDFRCLECGEYFEWRLPMKKRNISVRCITCSGKTKRLVLGTKNFSFLEGNGPISSRNKHYWSNAEECRLDKQKKRKEEHKEKMTYDSKYREKQLLGLSRQYDIQFD